MTTSIFLKWKRLKLTSSVCPTIDFCFLNNNFVQLHTPAYIFRFSFTCWVLKTFQKFWKRTYFNRLSELRWNRSNHMKPLSWPWEGGRFFWDFLQKFVKSNNRRVKFYHILIIMMIFFQCFVILLTDKISLALFSDEIIKSLIPIALIETNRVILMTCYYLVKHLRA